jgi:predicted DNA-binding protein (MmcQ/YjbR family)
MNIEEIRDYCIHKKGATESFPFDNKVLVFKVMNKVFALTNIEEADSINLKCDPERAIELREQFMGVNEGFHMSKKHWNTILIESDVNQKLLEELINHSYALIAGNLTKQKKEALNHQ